MKKFLFLMLATFALASCNDDCDHGFDGGGINSDILVGSWYEDTQNEEDTYSPSSAFYGKYCNKLVQGEGQGTYRLDSEGNRLTWSYHVNGMGMTSDWKLRDISKYQFVQYSDVAVLTYGKVVETYNMNGGATQQINFTELNVQGYESTNENIAIVSSSGLITTTGEKGTVYIKVRCTEATVYVKVVVGEEYPDLWIDYSSLLGEDYAGMKSMLGDPDKANDDNNGYSLYVYVTELHNILKGLRISINSDSHKIDQVDMIIREGVPQEELLAYMNAHYFRLTGNYGTQYHYSTSSEIEKSRAVYAYDTEKKAVIITDKNDYLDVMYRPWPDFNSFFGLKPNEVRDKMQKQGHSFLQSYDSYSFDGSDAYVVNGYANTNAVEFVFNPNKVVSDYWVYLSSTVDQAEVLKYLRTRYVEAVDEYVESYGFIFYNETKTLKLVLKPYNNAVIITDLSQPAADLMILRNYWKGLGMTKNELKAEWGEPYYVYSNEKIAYVALSDYTTTVNFMFDAKTKRVNLINLFLREEVESKVIKAYLNRLYTFKEEVSTDEGPLLRWLNAESEEKADMQIGYYPDYDVIVYKSLVQEEPKPAQIPIDDTILPDYTELVAKTASQVKESMGNPEREMGGSYVYSLTNHKFVKRLFVKFSDNPITDNSLVTSVSVSLYENHNQEKMLEYLQGVYLEASQYTTSTAYGFMNMDGSVLLQYTPSSNTISYLKSYGF